MLEKFGVFSILRLVSGAKVSNKDVRGIDFGVAFMSNDIVGSFSGDDTATGRNVSLGISVA